MSAPFRIKTPHAAVLVWNYIDRVGKDESAPKSGVTLNDVEPMIISTLSCISIQTSKSKGNPEGSFQLVLAPTKNWVSTLTPGSWLAILMSNEPITQDDLQHAKKSQVKMIGKIESVRVETNVNDEGARMTRYLVAGVDWGHIFNNVLYVDNLIASENDPTSLGNNIAVVLRNMLFGDGGTPNSFLVKDNLRSLIGIFGQSNAGLTTAGNDINRLAKSIYNFNIPKAMVEFFSFVGPTGPTRDTRLNKILNLKTGSLKKSDTYTDSNESEGFIDPFSLQGQHTFWQVLIENSNPILNEMYPEMTWNMDDPTNNSLQLTLYNRIKPFSYQGFKPTGGSGSGPKSFFQNCRLHTLDDVEVMSVNAGTNWRDKFNFIEIKPNFQEFNIIANCVKQKSQTFDFNAFEREGFRPLIMETKQFPTTSQKSGATQTVNIDWTQLKKWVSMMREWYFNTHRMLNGTTVIHGTTEYIAVGDNIRFNVGLVNPTPNMNAKIADAGTNDNQYVLAHVENISHAFSVSSEGARSYTTTIQFVRGIVVDGDNKVAGEGPLDKYADKITINHRERNTENTISFSDLLSDPDPQKLKGT